MSNRETSSLQESQSQTESFFSLSCGLIIFTGIGLVVVLILVGPTIAQWGYCRGWWLKSNPLAYSWWLCECDWEFEQTLYSDNIEVVVSACRNIYTATLSPDGRYMIGGFGGPRDKKYLLDLVTGSVTKLPLDNDRSITFWTDSLAFSSTKNQLLDVTDQAIIGLKWIRATKEGNTITMSADALQAIQKADRVLVPKGYHTDALALSADPKQNPEANYVIFYPYITQEQLEAFLIEKDINYEIFEPCSDRVACISHDGRFEMRWSTLNISTVDGQILADVSGDAPSFKGGGERLGWAYDNSGIYLRLYGYCIIEEGPINQSALCLPPPIVKLKVPVEYR